MDAGQVYVLGVGGGGGIAVGEVFREGKRACAVCGGCCRKCRGKAGITILAGVPETDSGTNHWLISAVDFSAKGGGCAEGVRCGGRGRHIRAACGEYDARSQQREQISL